MSLQLIRPDIDLDFVGKRYFFVALSTAINILAIVLLFTKGLNYGVDFVGGSVAQIEFSSRTNGDAIQKALAPLDLGEITVQDFGKAGQSFLARFETVKNIGSIGPKLETALDKSYGPGVA
jgi:preprotein translocase subunit SecF